MLIHGTDGFKSPAKDYVSDHAYAGDRTRVAGVRGGRVTTTPPGPDSPIGGKV